MKDMQDKKVDAKAEDAVKPATVLSNDTGVAIDEKKQSKQNADKSENKPKDAPKKDDKKIEFRTVTPSRAKTEYKRPERTKEYEEKVLGIDRVARVVKGGRRFKFRVAIVIGNKDGKVGVGIGKGSEVVVAVNKAVSQAKKCMTEVTRKGTTIPFDIRTSYKSAKLILKPAPKGTGIIAGGAVRAVVDLAGISDISSKMVGSSSKINNMFATFYALQDANKRAKAEQKK